MHAIALNGSFSGAMGDGRGFLPRDHPPCMRRRRAVQPMQTLLWDRGGEVHCCPIHPKKPSVDNIQFPTVAGSTGRPLVICS